MAKELKNTSDYKSAAWRDQLDAWAITEDLWRSALHIRKKGAAYLDQFNKEPKAKYERRLNQSVFLNEFRSTIETFGGMVFKTNPAPTEAPKEISELFADIDLCGNNLHSFLLDSFEKFLRDGNGFIFVDAPVFETNGERPTLADRAADRPFWIFYTASQLINHQFEKIDNRSVLSQVTIAEQTIEANGQFGEKSVVRHRILRRGSFEVRRFESEKDLKANVFTVEAEGETGLPEIPLIPIAEFGNVPPLLVIALLNLLHYNKTSDFDDWCHLVCVPERIYKYDSKEDAEAAMTNGTISPGIARNMWGEHADAKFNEISGTGVELARTRYQDIEGQMAKVGVGLLAPTEIVAKTATEIKDTSGKRESRLAKYTRDFENAVEKALYFTAEYINAIKGRNTVNLNDAAKQSLRLQINYDRLSFSMEQLNFFNQMVDGGRLSLQTFLEWLQMSTEMPMGFDVAAEIERLAKEKPLREKTLPVVE